MRTRGHASPGNDPSKSWVTMETHICPACGQEHETGAILMDRRLRNTFGRKTATGYDFCPEHAKQLADGYVLLVEVEEEGSQSSNRTGTLISLKREVAEHIFNVPIKHMAFISREGAKRLYAMLPPECHDAVQ